MKEFEAQFPNLNSAKREVKMLEEGKARKIESEAENRQSGRRNKSNEPIPDFIRLGSQNAVVVLPSAQQFVQILGTHFFGVFLEHGQFALGHRQHMGVGLVHRGNAGDIFVHDLLQAELQHLGGDVVGVNVDGRGVILVGEEITHRGIDFFRQFLGRARQFGLPVAVIQYEFGDGLGCDAPFGMRA